MIIIKIETRFIVTDLGTLDVKTNWEFSQRFYFKVFKVVNTEILYVIYRTSDKTPLKQCSDFSYGFLKLPSTFQIGKIWTLFMSHITQNFEIHCKDVLLGQYLTFFLSVRTVWTTGFNLNYLIMCHCAFWGILIVKLGNF
ncbi:hypothetical protein KUTeg_015982 [Tegillarca granosa]|uniref:Uncharacterized protein n=1 Tax=Tegillarca granosa TaxID=220873 RepID=A0ABQ9EJI6_TEGGR|nr:hypothetical protein KUTeg_015982 [Tegillarca granosa]